MNTFVQIFGVSIHTISVHMISLKAPKMAWESASQEAGITRDLGD